MRLVSILLFLFCCPLIYAQHAINGQVVDAETGEGLIGAHVYFPQDWRNGVITDMNGAFSLKSDSTYSDLIVSYVGYQEYFGPLGVEGLIKMQQIVVKGEEVVITAAPLVAEEFRFDKINKIEIYTNPAAKADPILAVNSLPSATTTDESANISLRGSSSIETGTFLNNVPVYDAVRYSQLNGIGTFSIFNTSIIQDVSVFPGNPPLEFGSTTSGVISLRTDESIVEENTNAAIISLASIGASREQRINGNQSLKLFSNWQPSAAMKALNSEALRDIEDFESGDLGIYWYGSTEKYAWKVLNYSVLEGYQFHFNHPSFSGIFSQKKVRSFLISSLDVNLKKGRLSFNNGLSGSFGEYEYSNVAFETTNRDFFFGTNYLLNQNSWSLKTGVSVDYRKNATEGNFHSVGYALGENHPTVDFTSSDHIVPIEGFLYGKYFLSDQLTLGTGIRKNLPVENQPNYLSRQLNLSYSGDRLNVILGTGKYHKIGFYENSDQTFFSKSQQTSMDVRYEWSEAQISVSYFDKKSTFDGLKYEVNGWEFFGEKSIGKQWRGSTSVTLLNASSMNETPYLYDINYFIRANLAYRTRSFWTVELLSSNRQGILQEEVRDASFDPKFQVFEPIAWNTGRLPDYFNLGLSISKMYFLPKEQTLLVFASFNNILDYDNVRTYSYNFDYSSRSASLFSQRTGYVGVVINF